MIFESHAHFDDDSFNEDRSLLFQNMQKQGISHSTLWLYHTFIDLSSFL